MPSITFTGVYNGSQMRVYLDGVLDGTATATYTPGSNATGLRIGKSSFLYYPNSFNGRIDEVRVSNAAIYTSNFTPNPTDCDWQYQRPLEVRR